jgi:hypothetical protein
VPHLLKVHKSNTIFKSANLRICDLRNLSADCPSLVRVYTVLLCLGKADDQCRHEEVYIEQFLLIEVQVGITLTTSIPLRRRRELTLPALL